MCDSLRVLRSKMYIPSISVVLSTLFLIYIAHNMWVMKELFSQIECTDKPCYSSFLARRPRMQLGLFISTKAMPISSEVSVLALLQPFDYWLPFDTDYRIDLPERTRRNGSLYMHVVLAQEGEPLAWKSLRRDGPTIIHTMRITDYMEPKSKGFNLLHPNEKSTDNSPPRSSSGKGKSGVRHPTVRPVAHIMSHVHVNLLIDNITLSERDVPLELAPLIRINRYEEIMPILRTDFFNTRMQDLVEIQPGMHSITTKVHFRPVSTGGLRFMLLFEHTMRQLEQYGFHRKHIEEVKYLLSDANLYMLLLTLFVSGVHVLFDFLTLKNDVLFWHRKTSYAGLSSRTILWRAFSQIVIFLYLLDEEASLLLVIPTGLSVLVELWKCKKIHKLQFSLRKGFIRGVRIETISKSVKKVDEGEEKKTTKNQEKSDNSKLQKSTDTRGNEDKNNSLSVSDKCTNEPTISNEQVTEQFDRQGMRYLSYLLYPICLGGAVYSLLYQPHRSFYSWTLNSLVNGVYAFGFLFMLPQLFVNYKLKSVAALPWRVFMYSAFNTFIDDFFAFLIKMPTAHRVACLRDDVVFIIYLYQRWLYPIDKSRKDVSINIAESLDEVDTSVIRGQDSQESVDKKTN